ncbi:putative gustatory receptor 2a [Bradysia coprophila]|uniref:putative gustatory receptor 2a n=1 Tax=Bradysia coprophila TaxID=38358 RepID=UPI00187DB499|nr:putative gustatory receptor 2a [Bradysia coprophila]
MAGQESKKNKYNLWDALNVTFNVQRFFCTFPLSRQGNQIVPSPFATCYSIVSMIVYINVLTLAVYVLRTEQTTKNVQPVESEKRLSNSYLMILIVIFELVFNNVAILVIVLFSHIKQNSQIRFLQKLYDIDLVIMDELKMDINYQRLRGMCYSAYIAIFIYFAALNCYLFYKLHAFNSLTPGVAFMATLYQFQQSATAITTWTYVNYVTLVWNRFILIRKRQEDLSKEKKMLLKTGVKYTENVSLLSTLLMSYKELCSCIDVLNNLSGSILILMIAHDFTLTTSQVYLISWIIMDNYGEDKFELAFAVFLWMFPNLVKMGLTTFFTDITVDEVCNNAKACSYTLNKGNKNSEDEDVRCMLDSFDLWLLHHKIEFSANNFFKIDLNLLYAVIGALTSYVLILIQFKQQEETFTDKNTGIGYVTATDYRENVSSLPTRNDLINGFQN